MHIKYKIIEINPGQHSIVVRYFTDLLTEQELSTRKNAEGDAILLADGSVERCKYDLNITLWDVPAPTGDALHALILANTPIQAMELELKIKSVDHDTDLTAMIARKGVVVDSEYIAPTAQLAAMPMRIPVQVLEA